MLFRYRLYVNFYCSKYTKYEMVVFTDAEKKSKYYKCIAFNLTSSKFLCECGNQKPPIFEYKNVL